jgi:hypothetical protein
MTERYGNACYDCGADGMLTSLLATRIQKIFNRQTKIEELKNITASYCFCSRHAAAEIKNSNKGRE